MGFVQAHLHGGRRGLRLRGRLGARGRGRGRGEGEGEDEGEGEHLGTGLPGYP